MSPLISGLATMQTYLVCVAYFDTPLSAKSVSAAHIRVTKFLISNLKSYRTLARITQRTEGNMPRDPRWGSEDLGIIDAKEFNASTLNVLDRLNDPPSDAHEWASYSEIRGTRLPQVQVGWCCQFIRAGKSDTLDVNWDDRAILVINTRLLSPQVWKPERLLDIVNVFITTWSSEASPYFGHIHVESENDCKGGFYYDSNVKLEYPEHKKFNHTLWWTFTDDRPLRARSVYWGNYWGPRLASKVGREALDEFLNYQVYDGEPQSRFIQKYSNGAAFIGMSNNPLEINPLQQIAGFPANCANRMAVLQRILRSADAII